MSSWYYKPGPPEIDSTYQAGFITAVKLVPWYDTDLDVEGGIVRKNSDVTSKSVSGLYDRAVNSISD